MFPCLTQLVSCVVFLQADKHLDSFAKAVLSASLEMESLSAQCHSMFYLIGCCSPGAVFQGLSWKNCASDDKAARIFVRPQQRQRLVESLEGWACCEAALHWF